jgi:hypothetical protein
MVGDESCRQRNPHVSRHSEAVQKHDRRSLAAEPCVNRYAICFNLMVAKAAGKGIESVLCSSSFILCS